MNRVREAARRAVEETALRQVAREVGMSAPGLANFLQGGEPLKPTARKLAGWYLRRTVQPPQGIDADTAAVALALLVEGLPASEAKAARADMLAVLRKRFAESGTPPPEWLKG